MSAATTPVTTPAAVAVAAPPAAPVQNDVPLSSFWLLGDTQINNSTGDREHAELHDAVENVAIRPASLDLWSGLVLTHVLDEIRKSDATKPLFFLGDGANTSCLAEYQRFVSLMGTSPDSPPWFAAIGNHDGYYMGNLGGPSVDAMWASACHIGGNAQKHDSGLPKELDDRLKPWITQLKVPRNAMPKALAVLLYLNALRDRKILDTDPLDMTKWDGAGKDPDGYRHYSARTKYKIDGKELGFAVDAYIKLTGSRANQFEAFVTQDVEIPGGDHVLIADTSDFAAPPPEGYKKPGLIAWVFKINDLPGALGMVQEKQAEQLASYIPDKFPGHFWLVGHHDWQSISRPGAFNIRQELFGKTGFVTYASGHTHDPTARGAFNATDRETTWELNVASTTDWPMEYVKVSYRSRGPRSSIHVDTRPAYSPGDEQSCTISRPNKGTADGDETDNANELSDANDLYVARAVELLMNVMARADKVKYSKEIADADKLLKQKSGAGRFLKLRSMLVDLQAIDAQIQQAYPEIKEDERRCATWASHIEQRYWAGSWKGAVVRFVKCVGGECNLQEKSPINLGTRIETSADYDIEQSKLPVCPDTPQKRRFTWGPLGCH